MGSSSGQRHFAALDDTGLLICRSWLGAVALQGLRRVQPVHGAGRTDCHAERHLREHAELANGGHGVVHGGESLG